MGKRKRLIRERKQRQRNKSAEEWIKHNRENTVKKIGKLVFNALMKEAQRQEAYRWN